MTSALPVRVEHDAEGLQLAVRALFEESLAEHRLAPVLEKADDEQRDRILAELPMREISPGYYKRAAYLVDLANILTLGIPMDASVFTQADVTGIAAVRRAKNEFEREHPACPSCGERQDNAFMRECFNCHQKLRGGR